MEFIDFYDSLWVEDPKWHCDLDDRDVKLGAVFKVLDVGELDDDCFVVGTGVMPAPEELGGEFRELMISEGDETRESLIRSTIEYEAYVPINILAVTSESSPKLTEFGLPAFETNDEAMAWSKAKAPDLEGIFVMIGFYLDKHVNRIGTTGWDIIKEMIGGPDAITTSFARLREEGKC